MRDFTRERPRKLSRREALQLMGLAGGAVGRAGTVYRVWKRDR